MKVQTIQSLLSVTLAAAMLTACGSSGITGTGTTTQDNSNPQPVYDYSDEGGATASYNDKFSAAGLATWTSPVALRTDSKLVVTITAGLAGKNTLQFGDTNMAAEYKCAKFEVSLYEIVNGTEQRLNTFETSFLTTEGSSGCTGSVASQTIDLSAYLNPGHGLLKFKVTPLRYDFYCNAFQKCRQMGANPYWWPKGCQFANDAKWETLYCPSHPIWQSHVVTGNLKVQVNGTL